MKKIHLLVLLAVVAAFLVGCIDSDSKDKKNQTLINLNSVESITIKKDSGETIVITDDKLLKRFADTIHSAEYDNAKLDIVLPEFVATIESDDREDEEFSLWLKGEIGGLFVKSGQNGHYKLATTEKEALLDLFQFDEQQTKLNNTKIDEDIGRITLANSLGHGLVNPEVTVEYTDNETIEIFIKAIYTAVQIPGILDTATPDYDIVLASDNKEYAYHLWINDTDEQGMLMDVSNTHTGYTLTKESTAEMKKIIMKETSYKELEFRTERNTDGDLIAKPIGLPDNNYVINVGPVVELQGSLYHNVHLFYGDHNNAINALVAHDPSTDEVHVKWNDKPSSSNHWWNSAFSRSYTMLFTLDEDHLLFLESELTEEAGQYHLSSYNVLTGTIERLRKDFWPLTEEYDYIYKFQWNVDKQQLFMQSYLGNVWIFDLKTGEDDVHLLKYRVIPHSTTGAPSLFLSPTFERFVHDDESGKLTFYNNKGFPLRTVQLPSEQYVPSEKIKWNPEGTIAWMDQAEIDQSRILASDIDYLKIAPQEINFYNQDGISIGSIHAEGGRKDAAVEVAGWIDADVAVMKSYIIDLKITGNAGDKAKDVSYFLYDVKKKKRGETYESMPPNAMVILDQQEGYASDERIIITNHKEIIYKSGQ